MDKMTAKRKAQLIRDRVDRYVSQRLGRGNIRIQNNAFHTESEWDDLRNTQAERMIRLNERLNQ